MDEYCEDERICDDTDGTLIVLVQGYPILWDNTLKDYRDEPRKVNAWVSIGQIMNLDVETLKGQWKRLRTRFTRELKKGDRPSGSAAPVGSVWTHMEAMLFLRRVVRPRKTSGQVRRVSCSSGASSPGTSGFSGASSPGTSGLSGASSPGTSGSGSGTSRSDNSCEMAPSVVAVEVEIEEEEEDDFEAQQTPQPKRPICPPKGSSKRRRSSDDVSAQMIRSLKDLSDYAKSVTNRPNPNPKTETEVVGLTIVTILNSLHPTIREELQGELLQSCLQAQIRNRSL